MCVGGGGVRHGEAQGEERLCGIPHTVLTAGRSVEDGGIVKSSNT